MSTMTSWPNYSNCTGPQGRVANEVVPFAALNGWGGQVSVDVRESTAKPWTWTGTGEVMTIESYRKIQCPDSVLRSDANFNSHLSTPKEYMAYIREILNLTVTDLSKAMGVSRQAIYDWQADKAIASERIDQLALFANVASRLKAEGLTSVVGMPASYLLRRAITDGKSLLDFIRENAEVEEMTSRLIEIVKREDAQRKAFTARLQGRRPLEQADDGEPGISLFDAQES